MSMKMSPRVLLRAKELETVGIPLDEEVLQRSKDASRGLSIEQDPINFYTTLFDLASGGTGVMIGLTIWNESCRIMRLKAPRLEIEFCNQIRWLPDPFWNTPRKLLYKLDTESFERDAVLNHQVGRKSELLPEDWLDGFLLGFGDEPIPDQYRDRQLVEACLSYYDTRNNAYRLDLKFLISRRAKNSQRQKIYKEISSAKRAERKGFFNNPDPAESCIGERVTQSGKRLGQIVVPNKNVGGARSA